MPSCSVLKFSVPLQVTEERIRVRYGETDQMGHAYYANYLFWFEQARGALCRDHGFTYKDLEASGYFLPVVEVHVRYKGEVKYDDWITVRVWTSEVRRASMRFDYEIVREETGKVVTEGYSWHVIMGSERKAITIPDHVRKMLGIDSQ
jgi:acyl-CoA thioester hydrolase